EYFLLSLHSVTSSNGRQHTFSEQFVRAIEKTTDSIIITNREGLIEYVNPAFESISGYYSEEVIGQSPRLLKSGKHSEAFYKHLWATILAGETFRHLVVNRSKEGELFYEEQIITPVRNAAGEISHFVSTGRDVTARYKQEREQHAILTLSNALRKAEDRKQAVEIILEQTEKLATMDATAFLTVAPFEEEGRLENVSGYWKRSVSEAPALEGFRLRSRSVLDRRHPVLYPSARRGAETSSNGSALSTVGLPLVTFDHEVGVLWVGRAGSIEEDDIQLISAIGDIASNALHRIELHTRTEQRLERLTALHAIDKIISSGGDLRLNLELLLGHVSTQLHSDAASILLLDSDTRTMRFIAGRGFRSRAIREEALPVGFGPMGRAVLNRRVVQVKDLSEEGPEKVREGSLKADGFSSYVVSPLVVKERVEGALELFMKEAFDPDPDWLSFLEVLATQTSIAIDNATMFDDLRRSNMELGEAYDATIEGWARALELRDTETQGHAQRVTDLTIRMAKTLGIPYYKINHVRRGALLHDIGKLGIPDSILYKPGPLTEDEWQVMRQHPTYAKKMLDHVDYLKPALSIPYCHHERWNGGGYPQGLTGEAIPKEARIFAVIDVWDALLSDRPYRKAWTVEQTFDYLNDQRGLEFDPEVVDVFLHEMRSSQEDEDSPSD
ncbi:MAG: PAS domain S-box protein, partial [Acidobacteriota bacterium]